MKRPAVDGDHWRLDIILRRKAVSGDGSMEQHCYYRQPVGFLCAREREQCFRSGSVPNM